jgi:hypothetical protein
VEIRSNTLLVHVTAQLTESCTSLSAPSDGNA